MRNRNRVCLAMSLAMAMLLTGCAMVKVKKLGDRTYALDCGGSTDTCQEKAWKLCGGDFDTLKEGFEEHVSTGYVSNPSGTGMMATGGTQVENHITVKCVDK